MQAIYQAIIAMFQLFAMPDNAPVLAPMPRDTDTRTTDTSQAVIASLAGYQTIGYQSMSTDTRHPPTTTHHHA